MREKILSHMKECYEKNDMNACISNLVCLAFSYNLDIKQGKHYNHELKHTLFGSNIIRNPLGMKYTVEDYEKTNKVLTQTVSLLMEMNKHETPIQDKLDQNQFIDDMLIGDLITLMLYTHCFYRMSGANTTRMDECKFGKSSFVEQLMSVLVFFQDQMRILKQNPQLYLAGDFVTGMEFSVANKSVDYYEEQKCSISDSLESQIEGMNEIAHFLYYQYGKNLDEQITDADIKFEKIRPYENGDFCKYLNIAGQRHFLHQVEEGIRYGYYGQGKYQKNESGQDVYYFALENDENAKARRFGIFRKEYQFQSGGLLFTKSQINPLESYEAVARLADELLNAQEDRYTLLNLGKFQPSLALFKKAEGVAKPKTYITETLIKDYYLDCTIKGVEMRDFLCAHDYLVTLAEVVDVATTRLINDKDPSTFVKEVCIVDLSYLSAELARIHNFKTDYATELLNRFVFQEEENRYDDIFAQPLLKISKNQVVFTPALTYQMNLDRAIERQFIRFKKNPAEVGHIFEKRFIETLKRGYQWGLLDDQYKEIPNFEVNTNRVAFVAFDGKDIEFDVIAVLGDYLILTELKAIMASYDVSELNKRKQNIKEAVDQLNRRAESVKYDWGKIKEQVSIDLPDQPFDRDHIILVVCADSFDYTPLKYGDVFVTDDSTYLKYFTSPYVDFAGETETGAVLKNLQHLWEHGYPDAKEFMSYLEKPAVIRPYSELIKKQIFASPVFDSNDCAILCEDYVLVELPFQEIMAADEEICE